MSCRAGRTMSCRAGRLIGVVLLLFGAAVDGRKIPLSTELNRHGVRGHRRERPLVSAGRLLQEMVGPDGCTGDMMTTCQPSASPSFAPSVSAHPSAAPSVSFAPSQSPAPSSSPSASLLPSASPSWAPSATPSTPAPSASPSVAPSEVPTASLRPSQSPSAEPSLPPSAAPSGLPSVAPSDIPSDSPSATPSQAPTLTFRPSSSPTITGRPTMSPQPSREPSSHPTFSPTVSMMPTNVPTRRPTQSPTSSAMPSRDPDMYDTEVIVENGLPQAISTCRRPIPDTATPIEQLIEFNYRINLVAGANVPLSINDVARRLQDELSQIYLTCDYTTSEDFYTYSITSNPPDALSSYPCLESEVEPGSDCYNINGAFTATIFYPTDGRRLVEAEITDPLVYNSFANSLSIIFGSGALDGGKVVSTSFGEITNAQPDTIRPTNPKGAPNTGAIVGGVIGGLALLLLILAGVYIARRRKQDRDYLGAEELEDEEPWQRERKSFGHDEASEDMSGTGPLSERLNVLIVNEEESLMTGFMPPEDPRPADEFDASPTFVATDDIIDEDQRSAMKAQTERELGARPKDVRGERDYSIADTVDL